MARQKTQILLIGIAYANDSLILLPKPGGFDLPVIPSGLRKKKYLRDGLSEYGFEGVRILATLEPFETEGEEGKKKYIPYVFAYEKLNQPFKELPVSAKPEEAPELAARFLWRMDIYAPMYQEKPRTVPLLEPEAKKVQGEIECLEFFADIVGEKDLEDFRRLCDSAASIRRINEAFVALCNKCHVNSIRYEREREKVKKKGRRRR